MHHHEIIFIIESTSIHYDHVIIMRSLFQEEIALCYVFVCAVLHESLYRRTGHMKRHFQSIRRARPNHFCGGNDQICEELFDCRAFHTKFTTPPRVCAVLYQEHIHECHSLGFYSDKFVCMDDMLMFWYQSIEHSKLHKTLRLQLE